MNIFWKTLLTLTLFTTLWFVGKATINLYDYFRLNAEAVATIERWHLIRLTPSKFGYKVNYYFTASSKRVEKQEVLRDPIYPNHYAAEGDLVRLKKQRWTAYYVRNHPQISSLYRAFPLKNSLYALFSLAVFFYFVWLFSRSRSMPTS